MVDLKATPFNLADEDIRWVEETIGSMTLEEKVGQLFIGNATPGADQLNRDLVEKYHIGGTRYNPASASTVYALNSFMQENSNIPLLIASNIEAGGNGCCVEGTLVAPGVQCGATNDPAVAYDMGYVGAVESAAIGCNWCFAPVMDIAYNWRNTVIQTRAFGDSPDTVIAHGKEFLKAVNDHGIAACMKHFPGDGVDERDQHVVTSHNTMTPEVWDASFGRVYKDMIDAGVQSIMIGHIGLPEYSRRLAPGIKDHAIYPATLAREITTGLLREQLGFNGLAITDASQMLGLTAAMSREQLVPATIAAGCDMILFFWDADEDFAFMLNGVKTGIITEERLSEALHRILGVKAALQLHKKQAAGTLMPPLAGLDVIGCDRHRELAKNAAEKGSTLVKDTAGHLPIRPETHPCVKLIVVEAMSPLAHAQTSISGFAQEELEAAGFTVELQKPFAERVKGESRADVIREMMKRDSTKAFEARYDAVFLIINHHGFAQQAAERLRWPTPMALEAPWYVHNAPTVTISMHLPNHLIDIPMVKTYINTYAPTRDAFRITLEKIMGHSGFTGVYSENVFCDAWDTRL
jgi:beta-N-acetylhexosaminidase